MIPDDLGILDQPTAVRDARLFHRRGCDFRMHDVCFVRRRVFERGETSREGGKDTSMYGVGLMLGYLGFDGFTSTFQDKLFKGYQMETYNQMLWVNLCSASISALWLFSDSAFVEAVAFVGRHPAVLQDICTLSVAAMLGQLCILYTIREFRALLFATIMTTRQFLSILLSCLIFMHPLTFMQWLGTAMVFGSLYYQAYLKNQRATSAAAESTAEMREPSASGAEDEGKNPTV